ncbi:MAG TPA: Zn-ribbon domain-containing OB-fold protein [Dehalococcoidia bacterium]|jgi:uncharacterized OB-fold protein|nr:Zn-ribbon domain-containing OB-fold protein [Dehalococcoidia bacterium]
MPNRPLPRFPEPDTQPFWEATKEKRLTYQTCDECGNVIFFPRRHCPKCGSNKSTWHDSKGMGTVYTFSVVRQNRMPAFKDLGAYAVAYIDLDEGFRMTSNVVGVADPTKDVKIGQRVKVEWLDQEGTDIKLPVFAPA